jgi:hypothetical protein
MPYFGIIEGSSVVGEEGARIGGGGVPFHGIINHIPAPKLTLRNCLRVIMVYLLWQLCAIKPRLSWLSGSNAIKFGEGNQRHISGQRRRD